MCNVIAVEKAAQTAQCFSECDLQVCMPALPIAFVCWKICQAYAYKSDKLAVHLRIGVDGFLHKLNFTAVLYDSTASSDLWNECKIFSSAEHKFNSVQLVFYTRKKTKR